MATGSQPQCGWRSDSIAGTKTRRAKMANTASGTTTLWPSTITLPVTVRIACTVNGMRLERMVCSAPTKLLQPSLTMPPMPACHRISDTARNGR